MPSPPEIRIRSVGTELPGPPIDNEALVRRLRMPSQTKDWIEAFVGTRSRHFAFDLETGEVNDTLTDMGEAAARRALKAADAEPGQIDLLVMGTSTPDTLLPTTASQIADRLGIDGVPVYQLQSGCTGAMQAMAVASQLLRGGEYRNALVLGADTTAKYFDLDAPVQSLSSGVQVASVMFGDAAGAAVLSADPDASGPVLRTVFSRLVGLNLAPGHTMNWYAATRPDPDEDIAGEDYKAIEQLIPKMAAEILDELLADQGWKAEELDYLLPPQLSGVMTGRIARQLAQTVPGAREVSCVLNTGNTANALPFLQLDLLLPMLRPGQRAVAVSAESSKWIKAGFALEMEG